LQTQGLRLAGLLAARLCQEASGCVGTLAEAIGIASRDAGSSTEALALAAGVAGALSARLNLLRAAWAGADETLDHAALRALCVGLPPQVSIDFAGLPAGRGFSSAAGRVLLNALLLAAESLPSGGAVIVAEAGPEDVLIVPHGPRAGWPQGMATWMADPASPWRAIATAASHGLQGPLTVLLAHVAGIRMSFALAATAEAAPPLLLRFPLTPTGSTRSAK
jgi:hypothetical protein